MSLATLVEMGGFPGPRYASLLAFNAAQLRLLFGSEEYSPETLSRFPRRHGRHRRGKGAR